MNARYFSRDLKNLPPPGDEIFLTALASFVVGAGFAVFMMMYLVMGVV